MLRRTWPFLCSSRAPRRICYLTDVEGNMRYFQRFVQMSACVCWERAAAVAGGGSGVGEAIEVPEDALVTEHDIRHNGIRLTFRDAHTHFVFGGDAFDFGADLSFGAVLLDFKARFPDRVHFILGNRDINKTLLVPAMLAVESCAPDEAERLVFPHHRNPTEVLPADVHYAEFLEKEEGVPAAAATARRVTFLKWALKHKMGAREAFENRRRELAHVRRQARAARRRSADRYACKEEEEKREADEGMLEAVTDEEVARSFFDAARPGGVYYEFYRLGVVALPLGGVLFVHGGVNEHNVGFVPDKTVRDVVEQAAKGARFAAAGKDALAWIAALNAFKEESFQEWSTLTGGCGEAMRRYVYPKRIVPYSVTVGSFADTCGPQHVTLPVMEYLLASGLHTVCGGHQPTGDSPAIVRQPGGFVMIDADNSYSGRGNEFCSAGNQRGLAVQEVIFRVDEDEVDGGEACSAQGGTGAGLHWDRGSVVLCGLQADGRPFHFNLDEHPLIGRCVGDDWWVKLPLYPSDNIAHGDAAAGEASLVPVQPEEGTGREAPFYELHRTRDGYRSEEVQTVTTEKLKNLLQDYQRRVHVPLPGELTPQYTKEALAEVRVHRIKTKVPATSAKGQADA